MTSILNHQLEQFRLGSVEVMKKVYLENKSSFIGYFKTNYANELLAPEDLYQDSFCVLHKNILSGKLTELTSSWSTILIGIGKNLHRNELRKKREIIGEDLPENSTNLDPSIRLIEKEKNKQAKSILGLVGETCKQVLVAFYYRRMTMNEIADLLDYADANVAKKKKSQCLSKLREQVKKYEIKR